MATIESLVHRQTWVIDDSPFKTIDRIQIEGQFVSTKPPLLSFVGATIYAGLHHGLGWTLQATGCDADIGPAYCRAMWDAEPFDKAYFVLTLLLISTPGTLLLLGLYQLARKQGWSFVGAFLFVALVGLGTALFPFITVFTNHVPAAAALFGAFYLLISNEKLSAKQLFAAGFLAALAGTLDLSAGLFLAALGLYVLWRYRQGVIWFGLGGLIPLALLAALDYQAVGTILPPHMIAEGYEYEGSVLNTNIAGFSQAEDIGRYTYRMLVGDHGVIAFYPLIGWFLAMLLYTIYYKKGEQRQLAIVVGVSTVAYVAYFVFSTDNFGGVTYSPRWLLMPVPLLATFAVINVEVYRAWWQLGLIAGLAVLSIMNAERGALNPWHPSYPIIHLDYTRPEPRQFVEVAISGYSSFDDVDAHFRDGLGFARVPRRWFDAREGMVVPAGTGWWFIGESTPLAGEMGEIFGLEMGGSYAFQADLTGVAEAHIAQLATDVYQSPMLVPATEADVERMTLPVTFTGEDGDVQLVGYQWEVTGEMATLLTVWEVTTRLWIGPEDRNAFVHLLDESGQIVQQDDGLAANYGSLMIGDRLFNIHRLPLAAVEAGRYWAQIGLYRPDTGARILTTTQQDRLLLGQIEVVVE